VQDQPHPTNAGPSDAALVAAIVEVLRQLAIVEKYSDAIRSQSISVQSLVYSTRQKFERLLAELKPLKKGRWP
jgi:hypothetical protein